MKRYLAVFAGLLLLAPAAVLAATNPAGVWEGTLKTPNGDMGFVFNVHRDGDKWAAEADDGKSIAGTFSAGGQSMPLDLKWKSEPRAVEKAPANSGDVQALEGVWEGVLDAAGTQLHLRFNFVKNADGGIAATLDSVDQGANGLPVTSIARTGDAVKMDLKVISGSYEATLNKDGSAMTGTFTQAGTPMPLNLQRKQAGK
jgi:hypothetical protein